MPRKKKRAKRKRGRPNSTFPARFAVGGRVQVKPGTTVPGFEDIPLGGWAGTIREVDRRSNPPEYLIQWDEHTLDHMHPVYLKRCERDDLGVESMWLGEEDLEPDSGGPAVIEQPTNIVTRPLRTDDQDDRIRSVFGLTSDDPLPLANEENLRRYHRYLATHLSFPFRAQYAVESGPFEQTEYPVTVVGLLDADDCDEEEGVLCEADQQGELIELALADLEGALNPHDRQVVEDYSYWFGNWPADDLTETGGAQASPFHAPPTAPGQWRLLKALVRYGLYGAVYGVAVGSLLGAVEGAKTGALVGALIVGFAGCWMGAKYGMLVGAVNRLGYGRLLGGFVGTVGGVLVGALIGAMAVAFLGTLAGGIIGGLLGRLVEREANGSWALAVIGAGVGAVGLAFYRDQEGALAWAVQGAWMGTGAGMLLVLAVVMTLSLSSPMLGCQM